MFGFSRTRVNSLYMLLQPIFNSHAVGFLGPQCNIRNGFTYSVTSSANQDQMASSETN